MMFQKHREWTQCAQKPETRVFVTVMYFFTTTYWFQVRYPIFWMAARGSILYPLCDSFTEHTSITDGSWLCSSMQFVVFVDAVCCLVSCHHGGKHCAMQNCHISSVWLSSVWCSLHIVGFVIVWYPCLFVYLHSHGEPVAHYLLVVFLHDDGSPWSWPSSSPLTQSFIVVTITNKKIKTSST